MKTIITRFAPSPTGNLHIGGVRIALINYIITKQAKTNNTNSKFLIRIEDTDKKRSNPEYVENIINGLKWLGIQWDDQIYFQSKRISRHQEVALNLLELNHAFKCICTQEQIEKERKENLKKNISIKRLCKNCEFDQKIQKLNKHYCIRIKIPKEGIVAISDTIQGDVKIKNKEIDNFILLRENGTPTYMLSSVVDDYDMNVNTVIRGNDHLNNTFRQYHLYKQLSWKLPRYAHIPLIHGKDGSKLSKRHGSVNINEFIKKGYLPNAIINNLILLGWSPRNDNEIIEMDEIINKFEINKLSKSSSIFNYEKLDFLNNYYIQKEKTYKYFQEYIEKYALSKSYFNNNHDKINIIYNAHKLKVKKLFEFIEIIRIYFDEKFAIKPDEILNDNFKVLLNKFLIKLINIEDWNEINIENCIKDFVREENINFSKFGKPMRYLLTNNKDGISISLIMYILGKKFTFIRINNFIK